MALKGKYAIAGRSLDGCYAIIQSLWGGKDQGWTARIAVYGATPTIQEVPVIGPPDKDGKPTIERTDKVLNRGQTIEEFTVTAPFVAGSDPYVLCYEAAAKCAQLDGWAKA